MSKEKDIRPSPLFLRLFRWFCDRDMVEDLEGDLLERFEIRIQKQGQRKARQLFIKDVVQLFRPGIIRFFTKTQKRNNLSMYKNYFKTAYRNLLRQKVYSSIKIGGFALGIAVCLLISLFIKDELNYNRHIPDHENIYIAVREYHENGDIQLYTWLPAPYAQALSADYPEVLQAGRMIFNEGNGAGDANIRKQGEITNYFESGFAFADQSILEIFDFPMVYGNQRDALSQPRSIVLSKSRADFLFPGINPIGQVVFIDDNTDKPYHVGGVIEDLPANSTLSFNYLMSLTGHQLWEGEQQSWNASNYQVFAKLRPGTDAEALSLKLRRIYEKNLLPGYIAAGYDNPQELIDKNRTYLFPFSDIHLKSSDIMDPFQKSDIRVVIVFGIIALFILGLACINFINLSTAKSANRAKEVGLRKAIGSSKSHLIAQFLTESVLYSGLSFLLAMGIASLLLPSFNQLAQKSLDMPWIDTWFLPSMLLGALTIGLIAGIYPAFYLSSFKPIAVLKGRLSLGSKGSSLRNVLVVFQFVASIVLIIGTFVVYRQMQYILNKEVGFDKEQVVLLHSPYLLGDNLQAFKNEVLTLPDVKSLSYTNFLPVSGTNRNGNEWWNSGKTREDESVSGQNWVVDHDYIKTMGMEIVAGRNFSKNLSTDSSAVIINEELARQLGIGEAPLGKKITNLRSNRDVYTVIGVVKDFNYQSLTERLEPLVMRLDNNYATASIKLKTEDMATTLADIEAKWKALAPGQPFISEFLDQRFSKMYVDTTRMQNMLSSLSILAVIIACLGLFGLSVFMVEQRNKEISIRLVLGATIQDILTSISFKFLKPVLIALFIATPIAWYAMQDWLSEFQYKIALSWDIFVTAGLAAITIAIATVSYQSLKAAFMKPVNGLRSE